MSRRDDGGGSDDSNRWLATYGDAVTLLLAFFIMLYAISQVDVQKFQLLVSGFEDPFKNTAVEEGLLEMGNAIVGSSFDSTSGIDSMNLAPPVPALATSPVAGGISEADVEAATEFIATQEDLREVREKLAVALDEEGVATEIGLQLDSRGLVVSIATDDVLFASGSPILQPEGVALIGVIAPILGEFQNEVRIEGHTDTVPLDSNGYTNWNLSTDRALSVLDVLVDGGFDLKPSRFSATGYGEYRPIASNDTEPGRQTNRRVELVIIAAQTGDGGTNDG